MPKVKELKEQFEKEIRKNDQVAVKEYDELVSTPSTSKEFITNTPSLKVQTNPQALIQPKKKEASSSAKLINPRIHIDAANELLQNLDCNKAKIEELVTELEKKLKNCVKTNSDPNALREEKQELRDIKQENQNLRVELKSMIPNVRDELNNNVINAQFKEADFQKRIKNLHAEEYIQLKTELFKFRSDYADYLKKNIEFEEQLLNNQDQALNDDETFLKLQSEANGKILNLYNQELALQGNIEKSLTEEEKISMLNKQLHASQTPEYDKYANEHQEVEKKLRTCEERILILQTELANKIIAFQDEKVDREIIGFQTAQKDKLTDQTQSSFDRLEENPLYEKEELHTQSFLQVPSRLAEERVVKQNQTFLPEIKLDVSGTSVKPISEKHIDLKKLLKNREQEVLSFWAQPLSEEKNQGAIPKKPLEQGLAANLSSKKTNLESKNEQPPKVDRTLKPQQLTSRLEKSFLFTNPQIVKIKLKKKRKKKNSKKRPYS